MKTKKILVMGIIVAAILGMLVFLPLALAFGKSGRETKVLGKDYSTLSKKEIIERLGQDFPLTGVIKLKVAEDKPEFEIKLSSISARLDEERMVSDLLYRRLNQGLARYIEAFFQRRDFELEVDVDKIKLADELDRVVGQINKPFIPSELVVDKGEIKVKDGQLGKKVDIDVLKERILTAITRYQLNGLIDTPTETIGELPTWEQKQMAVAKAVKLIEKKISFNWEGEQSTVDRAVIINWVNFDGGCNLDKIATYVANFSKSVKQEPRDAVFKFDGGKVVEFEAAKDGYWVDESKLNQMLCRGIVTWADSNDKEVPIELPLVRIEPKIKTEAVNDLGIRELLGRGTSSFRHSSEIRNFNVEKGASIINRILVAPGETFSFLENLGEVTLDNGFKKAYVIKKGKTELDVGGGICQVSTTLFRAMLDAGLNITQRTAHAYRVSYYEEDNKPGFDATVFIPSPDLKFVNDTGHHVLIQSVYDGINKKLTYEIYGTSDGRKVAISNYRQWDAQPAPPDVWMDDPTLPAGKVVKDESAVPGLKTSFEWRVTRGDEVLHQKTFVSSYVPWAAVYRRGPTQ